MKTIWEVFLQPNMWDVLIWSVSLFFAIRYGVMKWRDKEKATPWLYILFLCFYGGFLIYRLGVMKLYTQQLIDLCNINGIDLSNILGTY